MPFVRLKTPDGEDIIGTLDSVFGCALARRFQVLPDGSLDPEYLGQTNVWWDSQETERRHGERIYLDRDHRQWPESMLVKVRIEESEPWWD